MSEGQFVTLDALAGTLAEAGKSGRVIAAIAGPPGSGKSTIVEALAERLGSGHDIATEIVPMDGFHFDNMVLEPLGLLPRKGAPETFDVAGLASVLGRLRGPELQDVAVPVFDRSQELARAGARIVQKQTRVILVEGNYLLLDRSPWAGLRAYFDVTVRIDCDRTLLRERLMRRWLNHGFSEAEALAKVEGNDLPNGDLVAGQSGAADFLLRCDEPSAQGQGAML